jgi:hypothetical protein
MKSYELSVTPVCSKKFYLYKGTALVCEASDLGPARRGRFWMQRFYTDACDVGIAIRSHVTGTVVRFALEKEERTDNEDNELLAYHFVPLDAEAKRLANGIERVTIFND